MTDVRYSPPSGYGSELPPDLPSLRILLIDDDEPGRCSFEAERNPPERHPYVHHLKFLINR